VYRFYPDKPQQTQTILNESGRGENHYKEVVKRVSQRSVDVAIFTKEVDCVLKAVLFGVLSNIPFEQVFVITRKKECAPLAALEVSSRLGIHCVDEDVVLPNVTISRIRHFLEASFGDKSAYGYGHHSRSGWYYQQFLKLGFAALYPKQSSYTLVWDADMIPVRPMHFFQETGKVNFMESDRSHLGAYVDTFRKLFNFKASQQDFVSHHMLMYRPFVQELLAAIEEKKELGHHWTEHVIDAACRHRTAGFCSSGFSEYLSYSSWVLQKHPDTVEVVPCTFIRHLRQEMKHCPDPTHYAASEMPANITFAGFEAGRAIQLAEEWQKAVLQKTAMWSAPILIFICLQKRKWILRLVRRARQTPGTFPTVSYNRVGQAS
jgi:hypothetical protein